MANIPQSRTDPPEEPSPTSFISNPSSSSSSSSSPSAFIDSIDHDTEILDPSSINNMQSSTKTPPPPPFHHRTQPQPIRVASFFESSKAMDRCADASSSRTAASNKAARAQALDLQHTSAEAEGAEGVANSLRSGVEREDKELRKAREVARDAAADLEEEDDEVEEESATSTAYLVSYFIAGGAAGAASRTVVSPLERLKIIMQVQPRSAAADGSKKGSKAAYGGVVSGLVKMWKEEGFAGFMRGNGINCLRIVPYSAIQFCTYEIAKEKLKSADGTLDTPRRLLAGAIGGTFSCVGTFPLDLVRARISIASASLYADAKAVADRAGNGAPEAAAPTAAAPAAAKEEPPRKLSRQELRQLIADKQKRIPGIWAMTMKVYREEGGIRGLYRGCVPTSAGVAPYVAINFAAYEALRKRFIDSETGEVSTIMKLSCGAMAGSISQTITYPLDVLRRRMQVAGMKNSKLGYNDKNAMDAIRNILKRDGFLGLYRGLWPNLLKVAPSIGTSFLVYETVQSYIHPHPPVHHAPHQHHNGNGAKQHS